jgi:cysteinyl-tRNA synthetase
MSMKYLGETFDIHGGGLDLIFPHHENELAQAGGISGEILARYWLHNGYVTIDQEKMSKSLGNFFTLEDIFKKYEPETVRYFLLSTHYRHSIDFNEEKLKEAAISLDGLYQTFRQVEGIEKEIKKSAGSGPGPATASKDILKKELDHKFKEAMDNDFNTSMALGLMHDLSREINQAVTKWYTLKERGWEILGKRDVLQKWGEALGLFFKKEGSAEKRGKANLVAGVTVSITDDKIKELIAMRESARKNKEWKKADEIRLQLLKMGIIIEDTPMGARWYRGGLSE